MLTFLERVVLIIMATFFDSKMTTRKLRARSQSKQAEVFDLMQNWCIFFIQSLWRVFVLLSFLQKKRTIDYCNAVTYYYCQSGSTRVITHDQHSWNLWTKYRGFLPNATFGSGKKSHQPKFALAKLGKNSQKIALMK